LADPIVLRTALQTIAATRVVKAAANPNKAQPIWAEELERMRATLTNSITTVEAAQTSKGRADHSPHGAAPAPVIPLDPAAEIAMLHPRYGEHPQRLEMSVDALCTQELRASAVLSRISAGLTEKGGQGASATCKIATWAALRQASTSRWLPLRIPSSVFTTLSGGSLPALLPALMLPRVAMKCMPMAFAPSMLSSRRTPLGWM
jgi:hypothetical protein